MKPFAKILLVTTGAFLFNLIFWQEKMGINTALFDAFIISSVFYLYPAIFQSRVVKWLLAGHLITLAAVLFHNTLLSKLGFSATLLLVVVFTQYQHRSVWYAAASACINFIMGPVSLTGNIRLMKKSRFSVYGVRKFGRFIIIPALLMLVFSLLYNLANTVFKGIINDIVSALQHYFSRFFQWFSWQRLGFLLLGFFVTCGLLLKTVTNPFPAADARHNNILLRKKNNLVKWKQTGWFDLISLVMGRLASGIMALRNENTTGIISLALLNLLLLFINCIDVVYVWFGFRFTNDVNMSQYVHNGTGLLIFSILLAMVLLLFFFRGNLNFYKKNKWLLLGAYAWLLQNAILVISVLLRDYYYIAHFGLAYKRIGVLVFLSLVLAGLITVFIKIHQRKTTYYLLRINAWVAVSMLVICSCVHWDELIANYNLSRKNTIPVDVKFLLTLSDKVLPVLAGNMDVLEQHKTTPDSEGEFFYRNNLSPEVVFQQRVKAFDAAQKKYTWLSWNLADAAIKKQLKSALQTSSFVK